MSEEKPHLHYHRLAVPCFDLTLEELEDAVAVARNQDAPDKAKVELKDHALYVEWQR